MKYLPRILSVLFLFGATSLAADKSSRALPRSTPESQGVSPSALLAFLEAADQIDAMNSFMLVRHGRVVAEGWWKPYETSSNHELYSLSKSFTSTAVGMAIAEGKLSVDDEVLKFFPEDAPAEPTANLKAMRVRDLLSMSAGHQDETSSAADKVSPKSFLAHPVTHLPGTHFKYNTPATFMLSAIVQKQTGQSVLEYLGPRLFVPLGIEHPVWNTNFQGISLGGYGLRVRTEDIAKFGQLYLQKGKWQGRQLIPAAWVEAATARQVSNGSNPASDWNQGYGSQFWRCRHNGYRGDGAFGQYCIALPEQDAVIAITSGVKDMQAVMNLIWDKLLPALQPQRLAADAVNRKKLEDKLAHLAVRTVEGAATSARLAKLAGRKFEFPANDQKLEAIALAPAGAGDGLTFTVKFNGIESRVPCGYREWQQGRSAFGTYRDEPVAASGAWLDDGTCVVKLCAYETPFYATFKLHFEGNQVVCEMENNVGFGGTKRPAITGRAN